MPPSLNSFKSRLNKQWRNHPFEFFAACYMTKDQITGLRQHYQKSPTEAEDA